MLASHNSWSFLSSTKLWMKLLSFSATCQTLNIQEQYETGVRFFDLRIRFKNNKPYIVHGPVVFNSNNLTKDLIFLNYQRDTTVRVLLDIRKTKNLTEDQRISFQRFCLKLETLYPNIHFADGRVMSDWTYVYTFKHHIPSFVNCYGSTSGNKLFEIIPWLYAKLHNKKHFYLIKSVVTYAMFDFINKDYIKHIK